MNAPGSRIAISDHVNIVWLAGQSAPALCPNCGAQGQMQQIIDIDYCPPDEHDDQHRFILQICPVCSVRFTDNMKMMEYNTERLVERGEDAYHVQLGAGIWPITGQLARLDKPRGAKVLEIGGAYGFGLDFCIRARGWEGVGYDPSPFTAFGTEELGLPMRQEYFTARHLKLGPWDVAIATELIEHVSYPVAFLLLMRRALGETGVLVLSTPNADFIAPDQPASVLMPLLSPGSHTVLQTAQSLEAGLRAAGFTHTHIIRDGMSLIAYASCAPIPLSTDDVARRKLYRDYLVERAALSRLTSDLRFGYAGRGIFEAANDGDWDAANAAWAALLPAAQARFGLDLDTMTALPAGAEDASLVALSKMIPLGLGMILFGRAMCLLQAGKSRAQVEPLFRLASASITALLRALAKHSLQDGLSADIGGGLLRTELLLCAAAAGRDEAVSGLHALGDEQASWRGFIEMVNAGQIELAAALKLHLPAQPSPCVKAGLRRNALLCLVNFHLAAGGDPLLALPCAQALRASGDNIDVALCGIFTRLVNAGRYEEADQICAREPVLQATDQIPGAAALDARFAGLMLDLQRRPLQAACKAASWRDAGGDAQALAAIYVDGFIRLVNAGDLESARSLQSGMEAHLALCPPRLKLDALSSWLLLDAHEAGDAASVPARLDALRAAGMDEVRLTGFAFQAFSLLVNREAFAAARQLLPVVDPALIKLRPPVSAVARDALFAAGILFLQHKDDWRRGAASFARLRDDLVKQMPKGQLASPLFWSALRGEVIALHKLNRGAEATSLLRAFLEAYPDAPDDLCAQLKGEKKK